MKNLFAGWLAVVLTGTVSVACLFLAAGCRSKPVTHVSSNEHWAVVTAVQEANRRGWKNVETIDYRFDGAVWVVRIARKPYRIPSSLAVVEVSPEGKVTKFLVNSR
jgi:hypothetical protein